MKVKALTAFLCLLLAFPVLSGCGKHPDTETELSVTESQMTEKQNVSEIPDEVKQRLQAALDTEPITIPAEEWTVDTICQATYINGKNLTIPCTLHDFGDGFEICETEDKMADPRHRRRGCCHRGAGADLPDSRARRPLGQAGRLLP